VDWIGLALDRYRWRALVNSVRNLRVPQNAGYYRMAAQLVASLSGTQLHRKAYCSSVGVLFFNYVTSQSTSHIQKYIKTYFYFSFPYQSLAEV
jgi:hypothetical protein